MSWPSDIPKIKDGVTSFTSADINPIIEALELRTTLLKQNIINDNVINGVGFSDIGLSRCNKGQFIAYDKSTQEYVPAAALWDPSTAVPADCAYVVGVLISEVVDGRGTVLTSGILRNKEMFVKLFNSESYIPGNYYLTYNGHITSSLQHVAFPVRCGVLTSSGYFIVNIQTPDFRTHTHTRYMLSSDYWRSIESIPADIDIPAEATYYYNNSQDNTLTSILRSYISNITLVVDNKILLDPIDYEISQGYIFVKTTDIPVNSAIYATNPFMGIVPWLTSMNVTDNNKLLQVTQAGQTALLDLTFPVLDTNYKIGQGVITIDSQGITTGPVVQELFAGPGITIQEQSPGVPMISATAELSKCVELNILNGNGIVYGGDSFSILKFPAGKTSSLIGSVRAPNGRLKFTAKIFMYIDNISGNIPNANCEIQSMLATEEGNVDIKAFNVAFTSPPGTTSVINWTTNSFDVDPSSLLNITVGFTDPPATINVRAIGVEFIATEDIVDPEEGDETDGETAEDIVNPEEGDVANGETTEDIESYEG